jgi:hypothetical protein
MLGRAGQRRRCCVMVIALCSTIEKDWAGKKIASKPRRSANWYFFGQMVFYYGHLALRYAPNGILKVQMNCTGKCSIPPTHFGQCLY